MIREQHSRTTTRDIKEREYISFQLFRLWFIKFMWKHHFIYFFSFRTCSTAHTDYAFMSLAYSCSWEATGGGSKANVFYALHIQCSTSISFSSFCLWCNSDLTWYNFLITSYNFSCHWDKLMRFGVYLMRWELNDIRYKSDHSPSPQSCHCHVIGNDNYAYPCQLM